MKITFKSNGCEDSWISSIIPLVASMYNVMYGQDNIVLKTQLSKKESGIDLSRKEQKNRIEQLRLGINFISNRMRDGTCTKELFIEYNNFLQELRGNCNVKETGIYSSDYIYEQDKAFHQMLTLAEQCYENVYMDCGMDLSPVSRELGKKSDLTFINIYPEKNKSKDVYLDNDFTNPTVCILMEYEDAIKNKLSNHTYFTYPFLTPKNIIYIPSCKEFKTANIESIASTLLYQYIECEPSDSNYLFIQGLKKVANKINDMAENVILKIEQRIS